MDIIEFAEAHNYPLFPIQKVVLKLFYGVPLDDKTPIKARFDWDAELVEITEADYVQRLVNEGRCNWTPESNYKELMLCCGRRAGKDHLLVLMMAYEACLLAVEGRGMDKVPPNSTVNVMFIPTTTKLGKWSFQAFRNAVLNNIGPLKDRMANDTETLIAFQTDQDIDTDGRWKGSRRSARASVIVRMKPALAKSLRGYITAFVGISEGGFLPKASADSTVSAADASLFYFRQTPAQGRMAICSSPPPEPGHYFKQRWVIGWRHPRTQTLCMEIPTWEMNHTVPASEFKRHWDAYPDIFRMEYGGQLMERVEADIPLRLYDRLRESAEDQGLTVNEALVQAVEAWPLPPGTPPASP